MKHLILHAFAILLIIMSSQISFAQCEPDTVNCKDVLLPGEICPLILPEGIVNISYEQAFTVIPPDTVTMLDLPVNIVKIVIDTVGNLPPGLN